MAVKRYAGDRYTGLSTDTKPTDILDGATFLETDTGNAYFFTGTTWQLESASVEWGAITGTLSDQTDLQAALNEKPGKGSAEIIGGAWEFWSNLEFKNGGALRIYDSGDNSQYVSFDFSSDVAIIQPFGGNPVFFSILAYNNPGSELILGASTHVRVSSPLKIINSTKTEGALYSGSTAPSSTANTLNYDGDFRATRLVGDGTSVTNVNASFLGGFSPVFYVNTFSNQNISGSKTFTTNMRITGGSKSEGYFYAGTTDPTGTTRTNYDGHLHATKFVGDGSGLSGVLPSKANVVDVGTSTGTTVVSTAQSGTVYYARPNGFLGEIRTFQLNAASIGTQIVVFRNGSGIVTFTEGPSQSILSSKGNSPIIKTDKTMATAICVATNTWAVSGDLDT